MEQNNNQNTSGNGNNNQKKKKHYGKKGHYHKPQQNPAASNDNNKNQNAELRQSQPNKNNDRPQQRNGNHGGKHHHGNSQKQKPSYTPPPETALSEPAVFESSRIKPAFSDDFIIFSDAENKNAPPKYVFTEEELDRILNDDPPAEDDRPKTEIIGIRFKKVGKMYYFDPNGLHAKIGDSAIVETARGTEFGQVCLGNHMVPTADIVQPLRPVLRIATPEDIEHNKENNEKEKEAFRICLEKIAAHELDMKLVDAQFTFDNSKLIFYFTSSGRVDFRDLVKDLASVFRIRIELRQIGIRDEAKLMGGLGVCGRPICCASFLSDFVQVSIKMAKEQNLSLNSNKISGNCGRLMCCLRYEHETYQKEIALTPPVDSVVETPDGKGTVIETSPLAATVKVKIESNQESTVKSYHRDLCKVLSRPEIKENDETNS